MEQKMGGLSCSVYTVKQLAALFGKSEDAIRRWKNEGLGKDEDNIKLRSMEREDGSGRKNARHLVFSREAVIEFVLANPFLMDESPQLALMMQAEGAWNGHMMPPPDKYAEDEDFWDEYDEEINTDFSSRFSIYSGNIGVSGQRERPFSPAFERRSAPRSDAAEDFRRRLREEAGFNSSDEWSEYSYDASNRGWKKTMPIGDRHACEQEYRRRKKTAYFALNVLRSRMYELDRERIELAGAEAGLYGSGLDESMRASLAKLAREKLEELSEQVDMLEEFIDVIEAEIEDD